MLEGSNWLELTTVLSILYCSLYNENTYETISRSNESLCQAKVCVVPWILLLIVAKFFAALSTVYIRVTWYLVARRRCSLYSKHFNKEFFSTENEMLFILILTTAAFLAFVSLGSVLITSASFLLWPRGLLEKNIMKCKLVEIVLRFKWWLIFLKRNLYDLFKF